MKIQVFYMNRVALVAIIAVLLSNCKGYQRVIDRPITFDAEREQLTRDYLRDRYAIDQDDSNIDPKMIVLHWTEIASLEKSFDAFKNSQLPNHRGNISGASGLNVSAHFLVDQDGTIYQLMPTTKMARHVIGLNHTAIGIENVGGTEDTPLTEKQIRSNIWLIKQLNTAHDIEYLIGHYEYTRFEGHDLWLEVDEGYRTEKVDPGQEFMAAVRQGVADLNLKEAPKNNP